MIKNSIRACLNFVRFLLDASFITLKNGKRFIFN